MLRSLVRALSPPRPLTPAAAVSPGEAHPAEVVLATARPHFCQQLLEPSAFGPLPLLEVLGPGDRPALSSMDHPIPSAAGLGTHVPAGVGHCCLIELFPLLRPVTRRRRKVGAS